MSDRPAGPPGPAAAPAGPPGAAAPAAPGTGQGATDPVPGAATGEAERVRGAAPSLLARLPPQLFLGLFLAGLVTYFSLRSPYFLSLDNFRNILLSVAVLGIIAVPATLLLVSANVDLSVGSAAAFCGMLFAVVAEDHGLALGLAAALLGGVLVGAINGGLVAWVGINSIITTLGTLSVFRGATKLLSNGQTVGIDGFRGLGTGSLLGVPTPVWIFALVAGVFLLLMRYSVFGRGTYALGANPHAARLVGIRPRPHLFSLFVISGGLAALAGLILTSQLRAATTLSAEGLELSVVAAVLLGGASLTGGRGTVIGTLVGVLILGTLNNGLTILNVTSFWQEVARGVVLILAVGFDQLRRLQRG